jgi:hypothetical protein
MPDGSIECGMILGKLEAMEEELKALREAVDEIKIGRAREAGQFSGATWALARVGAGVVALFGLLGWLAVNGFPPAVKRLLSP